MSGNGNGFDLCECVMTHEGAMRRLMNLLRNSQTVCNDRECLVENPGLQTTAASSASTFMLLCLGWVAIVFLLYMFRPNSMRKSKASNKGPSNDRQGPNFEPPSPEIH